ncbi:MAG: 4a-hydroxytetrahydrobiopterin dehydratase [Mycobacterium sp.]|nr:4a-hydroxytetrahydrobiopterin dehydratase [Mycobacterium sp.]
MDDSLTRQQISDAVDPLGWRLILGAVVTHVRVPSLSAAAEAAVAAVSAVGADGDGHLSLDLHADRVVLGLQTAATGFVTEHDVRLAQTVTVALAARELRTEPGDDTAVPQAIEIAIDALDIPLIRPFWKAVTGYVEVPGPFDQLPGSLRSCPPDLPDGALLDPLRRGPAIWFQQMDGPRPQRNRIHLDVDVAPELAHSRIDATLAAGGTLLSAEAAPAFWVLADPEGNEVCVCTWQGRD